MIASTQYITVLHTTAQSLGALLKSARDIMHRDKGMNGAELKNELILRLKDHNVLQNVTERNSRFCH